MPDTTPAPSSRPDSRCPRGLPGTWPDCCGDPDNCVVPPPPDTSQPDSREHAETLLDDPRLDVPFNHVDGPTLREVLEGERDGQRHDTRVAEHHYEKAVDRAEAAEALAEQHAEALREAIRHVEHMEMPDTGVIGPGGEREKDYHEALLHEDLQRWRSLADGGQGDSAP